MFIRTKSTPRSKSISVQLVESVRVDGKTKQRVIYHFGTAKTAAKLSELKKLANVMKADLERKQAKKGLAGVKGSSGEMFGILQNVSKKDSLRLWNVEEIGRYILGIHDIYGAVYKQLGFCNPFYNPARHTHAAKILREIVLARIACPNSKRASVSMLGKQFGIDINLDHVYQMMDKIDDRFCKKIQDLALKTTLSLTQDKLKVLFYDTTTLYFESFSEDELKQNGYSKDMKFNQPQVLLALFVTEKGLPVGYELFPGSTYEGHTLAPIIDGLKERYNIEKLVFVADRGLLSETNIKYLEESGMDYIVGARIKNMPKKMQTKILDMNNYSATETGLKIASLDHNGRSLMVNYSESRARKDRHDREKALERLGKKLEKSKDPKSLLSNYGYKKYIMLNGCAEITINEEKMLNDAKWDGLAGVLTNIKNFTPEQIFDHYRSLWQIEECFRINKHDLKIRPIYHFTPRRVKAHIAIAFMAFVCVKYLEYRVAVQSQKLSPASIRDSLLQVQASLLIDKETNGLFMLPSKIDKDAKEIYRVLGIKKPEKIAAIKRSA